MKAFLTIFLIFIYTSSLFSQKNHSQQFERKLLYFLASCGDYDSSMVSRSRGILIIDDLITHNDFHDQKYGVFILRTLTTHSYSHLLLKSQDSIQLINMREPYDSTILTLVKYFKENQFFTQEEVLQYLEKATEIYRRNQKAVPWVVD